MNIYIKLLLAVVIIVVLCATVRGFVMWRRRRREKAIKRAKAEERREQMLARQNSVIQAWIDGVNAATTDKAIAANLTVDELAHKAGIYSSQLKEYPGFTQARDRYYEAIGRRGDRKEVNTFLAARKQAVGADEVTVVLAFRREYRRLFDQTVGLDDQGVGELTVTLLLEDLERARHGDVGALRRFLTFRRDMGREVLNRYGSYTWLEPYWDQFPFPDDWNDLVATMIEVPSLRDFVGISVDPQPGHVRQMAAQALDERSLLLGKIVLAYCSETQDILGDSGYRSGKSRQRVWPYKQEIGDVLLAEVTKMVYAIHVERGLFVA